MSRGEIGSWNCELRHGVGLWDRMGKPKAAQDPYE